MPDVAVHRLGSAPKAPRPILAAPSGTWGFMSKLHGVLTESPVELEAYERLFDLAGRSSLPPAERPTAFPVFRMFHGREHRTMGHAARAARPGVATRDVDAPRAGEALADPRPAVIAGFARRPVEARGRVGHGALDAFVEVGFTREAAFGVSANLAAKPIPNYANPIAQTKEGFMSDPLIAWPAPVSA